MRSLLFNYLNILFLLLFTSSISAQVGGDVPVTTLGTVTNDGDIFPSTYEICLDENNQLAVQVNITLTNLQIMGTYPDEYGVIPSDYPDMSVEFTINGSTFVVEVGNFDIVTLPSGYMGFSSIAVSPAVDFSSECEDAVDGVVNMHVRYRLVTLEGDTWVTYPACDYENTMFTCYAYPNAPWCDAIPIPIPGFDAPSDPVPTCYNEWFSGGYSANLHCDCEVNTPEPPQEPTPKGGDSFGEDNEDIDNRYVTDDKINVYPNPMGELLHIESSKEPIRQIEVYNSKGDLLINNVFESDKNQNVSLNTIEFPNGLYLVRIATDSGIEIVKVLK